MKGVLLSSFPLFESIRGGFTNSLSSRKIFDRSIASMIFLLVCFFQLMKFSAKKNLPFLCCFFLSCVSINLTSSNLIDYFQNINEGENISLQQLLQKTISSTRKKNFFKYTELKFLSISKSKIKFSTQARGVHFDEI